MSAKITVIISAYNEEKLIGKCIEALQNQTFPKEEYEIIVVDNNSTDNTFEIAKKTGVSVFKFTKINRVSAVRQFGASKAKAPVVAFMDADSFATPNWLEEIDKLMKDPNIVAVCGVALPLSESVHLRIGFWGFNVASKINQFFGTVLPWGFNLAVKKEAFDKIGGFNTALSTYDDAEIGIRLKNIFGKNSIRYSQELKVFTSTRKQEKIIVFIQYILDTIKNYINVVILKNTKSAEIRYVR